MYKVFLFLLIFFQLISAKAPSWFMNPIDEEYKTDKIIVATGSSSNDYNGAVKGALVDLSNQIKTVVTGKSQLVNQSVAIDNKESIISSYSSISMLSTALEVEGFEIVNKDKVDSIYYVRIILDKEKYSAQMRAQLYKKDKEIIAFVSNSERYLLKGDIENALNSLDKTKAIYKDLSDKLMFYNLISDNHSVKFPSIPSSEILKKRFKIVKSIHIKVDTKNKSIYNISEKVIVNVKVLSDSIPLKSLRVTFFQEGDLIPIDIKKTNSRGKVELEFNAKYSPDRFREIMINIAPQNLSDENKKLVSNIDKIILYKTYATQSAPLEMVVFSDILEKEDVNSVKELLEDILDESGIKVVKKSKNILKVKVTKENLQSINTRFKRLQVDLNFKLYSNGKRVYSFSSKHLGVGKQESESLAKAIKSVSINDKDLTKIINKLGE